MNKSLTKLWRINNVQKVLGVEDFNLNILRHMIQSGDFVKFGYIFILIGIYFFGENVRKLPFISSQYLNFKTFISLHDKTFITTDNPYDGDSSLDCDLIYNENIWDVIVIGSGPGGAVAASNAINSNLRTLLIEKGSHQKKDTDFHSTNHLIESFAHGGQQVIVGNCVIPFTQGETFGGGSKINSGLYHKLPKHILQKWLKSMNLSEDEWVTQEIEVEKNLNVRTQELSKIDIYNSSPLKLVAKDLKLICKVVPRWRTYVKDEFFHHGVDSTYIKDAINSGLICSLNHSLIKFKLNKNKVDLIIRGLNCEHNVSTKKLILSAGAIETPKLLINSGFAKRRSFRFNLHLMNRVIATFDHQTNNLKDIDPHQIWSEDFDIKYGASVSTINLLDALLTNYTLDDRIPKKNYGVYYSSIGFNGFGRLLKIGSDLVPFIWINQKIRKKIRRNTRILIKSIERIGGGVLVNQKNLNLSTVHIFGTIPLGKSSVIDKDCYVTNTDRMVMICDSSLLPEAPLVNPQGPLLTLLAIMSKKNLKE
jgi:hypothetical protein